MNKQEKRKLPKEKEDRLLQLFKDFITTVEGKRTGDWRIVDLIDGSGVYLRCNNGTGNYISNIPTSNGILMLWNSTNPEYKFKEDSRYCVEDDNRCTMIYWKLKYSVHGI